MNSNQNKTTAPKIVSIILQNIELLSKIVGGIAALIALCAVFLPSTLWKPIESIIAQIYGTNGWVYYEVGENREITGDGNFYLLKETETGFYDEIKVGDKLRVSGDVNFRSGPSSRHPRSFVLINGDCVIVTRPPNNESDVQQAKSGGWLEVATSPCGLF